MNKTLSNLIYNGLYQLLIIAIPVLTVPYVSRILGARNLGINSYVTSIAAFLSVVIMLGLNQVGVKEIAESDTEDERLEKFQGLWLLQVTNGLVVTILFTLIVVFFLPYKFYFFLYLPYLFGYLIDVSWLYIGQGEIKSVVIRNSIVKLVFVAIIFIFVKSKNDLWIYALANSAGLFIANSIFWIPLVKKWKFKLFDFSSVPIKKYIKPNITVMLPLVAVQFYTNFDNTIVGSLAGPIQLTYYDQSQKMARVVLAVITSASTVLMPKFTQMHKKTNNDAEVKKLLKVSLDVTLIIAFLFVLLLTTNAKQFIPWFYGESYSPMIWNMEFVSLIIIFISYGGVFANQYAIPHGLYKAYALPYYLGAIVSVLLNLFFVRIFKANAATTVIVITELVVCITRLFVIRHEFDWSFMLVDQLKYLIAFLTSLIIGFHIGSIVNNPFTNMIIRSLIITVVYLVLIIILRVSILNRIRQLKK